jgi:hypothetical protein
VHRAELGVVAVDQRVDERLARALLRVVGHLDALKPDEPTLAVACPEAQRELLERPQQRQPKELILLNRLQVEHLPGDLV